MASDVWRLLVDPPASASHNMAVDEAMLRAAVEGALAPTLRFYGWSPPAVSIGAQQPLRDVDLDAVARGGFGLVRRPTGGRALLHADEVTYSIVAAVADPRVGGGVVESYRKISAGLMRGLQGLGLGVDARRASARSATERAAAANCFLATSHYEITLDGRKLVGSAQTRAGGVLLQHGSLLRTFDPIAWSALFPTGPTAADLSQRVAALDQVMVPPALSVLYQVLARGMEAALGIHLVPGSLTRRERELAAQLEATRYRSESWTGGAKR